MAVGYQELQDKVEGEDDRHHGTLFSTTLLFATSGMGAGMLTLPFTVQEAGPATALCLMLIGSVLSAVSTAILSIGACELEANTYGQLMERAVIRDRKMKVDYGEYLSHYQTCTLPTH